MPAAFWFISQIVTSRNVRLLVYHPDIRPPVYEEMREDIERMAATTARKYTDNSCPELSFEDLVAECHKKIAMMLSKIDADTGLNRLERIPTKNEGFKFVKTMFNNHVKSLVNKYRLTLKRGYRPQGEDMPPEPKNTDVHCDDPDQHLQIADPSGEWVDAARYIDDSSCYLTPLELLILNEFNTPSLRTLSYAKLDGLVKDPADKSATNLKLKFKHYALGLGLDLVILRQTLEQLGGKLKWINMNEADNQTITRNRAITRLEEAFGVQIPESLESTIVKRLFTIAALDQFDKVQASAEIREDLRTVGAKVPEESTKGSSRCFGVLYQRNDRVCSVCSVRRSCATECANFALGSLTISPRLLGAKHARIPILVPVDEPQLATPQDEEVFAYLRSNYDMRQHGGELQFWHRDVGNTVLAIADSADFKVRLCKPSSDLKTSLLRDGPNFYIPATCGATKAVDMIRKHAHDVFIGIGA